MFRFGKEERLCSKKHIQELFKSGSSFYSFPYKVFFLPQEEANRLHQVLISVPTRNFKKAVQRNLLKRRIREAYRLNKPKLADTPALAIALVYTAREEISFDDIQRRLILALGKIDKMSRSPNAENRPRTPSQETK